MSKNYEKYTLEDFVIDDDFIQWVKYPTPENDRYWDEIIKANPSLLPVIQKSKLAVLQLVTVSKQSAPKDEIPIIWNDIETDINQESKNKPWQFTWKNWAFAASILLMIGMVFWLQFYKPSNTNSFYSNLTSNQSKSLEEVVNTTLIERTLTLPDESEVKLKPNSKISYSKTFEGEIREVYLEGEASFNVKKNPKKPFMVYANGLITKVLGTSFSIKAFETDKEITVKVTSGKVSVYTQNASRNQDPEMNGVVLLPNQKMVFGKEDERFVRTLVEKPAVLISNQELQQFSFNDSPVEQIFLALEKAYGVKIIFDREVITDCRLTTSLGNENLFEKLDIICAGIDASYKVVDAQIIITSDGCN
jgi:hypothetical protein